MVYLEFWWPVWSLVQQKNSAWAGGSETAMRKGRRFGDNVRGGCWESRWGKKAGSLLSLLAGVTCCWVWEPREWGRSTRMLIYSRWLKLRRFLYYNPNENIFDNTNAYTWSWSEATILTSQWEVEISYEISLSLTFFICKWRHQYVLCRIFVVLKWIMSNMSRIQCLETGTLFPFFLYTYHSHIESFLIGRVVPGCGVWSKAEDKSWTKSLREDLLFNSVGWIIWIFQDKRKIPALCFL